MTSDDGATWDLIANVSGVGTGWQSVCFFGGQFVAVSAISNLLQAMTSPDGVSWTVRSTPANHPWASVAGGAGCLVSVASDGGVMRSADLGASWTYIGKPFGSSSWRSVCFGAGIFVAVSGVGAATKIMTSADGLTWTERAAPGDGDFWSVASGSGSWGNLFVATSREVLPLVITSRDGQSWQAQSAKIGSLDFNNEWQGICFANGLFVATSWGQHNAPGYYRVMTSGALS